MQKTANKLYKDYKNDGGTLSFKEWLEREKRKGFLGYDGQTTIPVNKPLNDSIQNTINEMQLKAGYKADLENKYIFGVHRNVWIGIGAGVTLVAGYFIYKKIKKL